MNMKRCININISIIAVVTANIMSQNIIKKNIIIIVEVEAETKVIVKV